MLSEAASRVWYGIPYPITRRALGIAHPIAVFKAIETGEPYQVRALIIQHHNPVGAYSGSAKVARALSCRRLELLVVHDLRLTPTAMLADYVLPAASWMEKPFLLSQGWGTPVVAGEQVLAPQGERRSDYAFCRDLGRRLGQEWPDRVEDVFDEWLVGSGYTYFGLLNGQRVLNLPDLRRRFEEIDPRTGHPYGFATPTGKVEFHSTVLERLGYDPLPDYVPPRPQLPLEDEFPLHLMTGATRIDATHQDHRQLARLRARHPDPLVEIDSIAAAAMGVSEGDWVRIVTPDGEVEQRARLVAGLGEDRVSGERWWYPERKGALPELFGALASNVNAYTDNELDTCDPAYGALPYRNARCRIDRASDSEARPDQIASAAL
jgi:anaerobic selenocysteine-containing dehydrogenase